MSDPIVSRKDCFWSRLAGLRWLAGEPYRIFFASGVLWSVAAVALWPLFYAGKLAFYPSVAHARLMIEAFGGAFVAGFLGTAGPRMASAPRLSWCELGALFALHQASAVCHLTLRTAWGDGLFAAMLVLLMASLAGRVIRFRDDPPPPQMLLALAGLGCGVAGAVLPWCSGPAPGEMMLRLPGLLLNQGFLLLPILGIGSFIFPRMLGGKFGEPGGPQRRAKLVQSLAPALLILASFFLEAGGWRVTGTALRAGVFIIYLLTEVRWRKQAGEARGSLATGLKWALALGALGLALAYMQGEAHRISITHLLYVAGFGLLMLIVGSRVLFGHSGDLAGFARRSGWVRFLIFLGVLAAVTRATPAWLPSTTVSHHIYAAWTWGLLALLWLIWHRRRFVTRDEE